MNGTLVPLAGGDPIPLVKSKIVIGRRPDCDIQLEFHNISGKHCELLFDEGSWVLFDKESTNGVMVNGVRIERKRLRPGDDVTFARKYHYRIEYRVEGNGNLDDDEILFDRSKALHAHQEEDMFLDERRIGSRRNEEEAHHIFGKSLLERAGLEKKRIEEFPQAEEEPYQQDVRIELEDEV